MIFSYDPTAPDALKKSLCASGDIVLIGGCFDVLHYGHVSFLQQAAGLGSRLVIALESDETIVQTKDRRVFHSQRQRAEILEALSFVDEVVLLPVLKTDADYFQLVEALSPKIIAMTQGDPQNQNKSRQADHVGGKTVVFPFEKGFSTTDLLEKYSCSV